MLIQGWERKGVHEKAFYRPGVSHAKHGAEQRIFDRKILQKYTYVRRAEVRASLSEPATSYKAGP
jgi:hypothetical protein